MTEKEDKLRKRLEDAEAKEREFARKAQAARKAISEIARTADTRRKIIDGAHMQTEALTNPEIAALLHRLRDEKLVLDNDRALFGLAPLPKQPGEKHGPEISELNGTASPAIAPQTGAGENAPQA